MIWLGIIVLVLGVIFGGIMTTTESAALGAACSIVMAAVYRRLSFAVLKESVMSAVLISSMFALLFFTAKVLTLVFLYLGITQNVATFVLELPFGRYGILAIIGLIYLIGGMFIEDWTLLLLTLPFMLPIVTELGYSPIWFGAWFAIWGIAGIITPPFGMVLFIIQSVIPKFDAMTIGLSSLPFVIPMLIVAALMVVFPGIALWLPGLLY